MDEKLKVDIYRRMVRIRMVEQAISDHYGEQAMRCPVHLSIGQEAAAVGACAALAVSDVVVSSHRCHAHYLAKGGNLNAMMAEIYGKATGCCGGRGGSMHLFDDAVGMIASVPIVSSSIPLGVGMALSMRQRGSDGVSTVFLGDASLEEGVFHECANFAAVKKLPVLFVCENNLYSVYTNIADRQPDRPLEDIAKAHGIPARREDGNDVEAVFAAAAEAARRARRGGGPSFLVFDTYRWLEHCGPNYDNDLGYRTRTEFDDWKKKCPLARFRRTLEDAGLWDKARESAMADELAAEIAAAIQFAKESPFPDDGTAGDKVYA